MARTVHNLAARPRRGLVEVTQPQGRVETKLEAFRRLATARTTNAVKAIGLVEKLGNGEVYDVRPGDVEKIVGALQTAIDNVQHALLNSGRAAPVVRFDD